MAAAFEKHVETYGGLDICINSAGIGNPVPFYKDQTDGASSWRKVLDVNLVAVVDCTRIAVCFSTFTLGSSFDCGNLLDGIDHSAKSSSIQIVKKECCS